MALWRIRRMETPPESGVTVDCSFPETPVQLTLHEDVSGEEVVLQACYDPTVDPCTGLLQFLHDNGRHPADWDTLCGFES